MDNAGLPEKRDDEEFDAFYAAFNVLTDAIITPEITRMVQNKFIPRLKLNCWKYVLRFSPGAWRIFTHSETTILKFTSDKSSISCFSNVKIHS